MKAKVRPAIFPKENRTNKVEAHAWKLTSITASNLCERVFFSLVRIVVLTRVIMNIQIFWDITQPTNVAYALIMEVSRSSTSLLQLPLSHCRIPILTYRCMHTYTTANHLLHYHLLGVHVISVCK
jgi:hypothetical protein